MTTVEHPQIRGLTREVPAEEKARWLAAGWREVKSRQKRKTAEVEEASTEGEN